MFQAGTNGVADFRKPDAARFYEIEQICPTSCAFSQADAGSTSNQYLRSTPTTRPWIFTSLAATMMGAISEFAGCRRIFPPASR